MNELAPGWTMDMERGPDCLFVKLHGPNESQLDGNELSENLWELLKQHFIYRVVLELDDVTMLKSNIVGQLVRLNKQVQDHDGMMRLCGLSDQCSEVLRQARLDSYLPQYRDREEALMTRSKASNVE